MESFSLLPKDEQKRASATQEETANVWIDKLIENGCNKSVVEEIKSKNFVKDYQKLHSAFLKIPKDSQPNIEYRTLCFLSGDIDVIRHYIETEEKGEVTSTKQLTHFNSLQLVVWSGSIEALNFLLSIPEIAALALKKSANRMTLLHCAAFIGFAPMINRVLQIPGMTRLVFAKDAEGFTAWDCALQSGSSSALLYLYFLNVGFCPKPSDAKQVDENPEQYLLCNKDGKAKVTLTWIESDVRNKKIEKQSKGEGCLAGMYTAGLWGIVFAIAEPTDMPVFLLLRPYLITGTFGLALILFLMVIVPDICYGIRQSGRFKPRLNSDKCEEALNEIDIQYKSTQQRLL